jgi:hypothetical protein
VKSHQLKLPNRHRFRVLALMGNHNHLTGPTLIVISVYIDAREATLETRTMAIAEVARVVGSALV